MNYFLDTEFIESGPRKPIQLISIGLVCEDDRELYRISYEFDPLSASPWVNENVLSKIGEAEMQLAISLKEIAAAVDSFIGDDRHPVFYGWYADYDWVVFAQLWGTMMDLPDRMPRYCRDLKQMADERGIRKLPIQKPDDEHSAIADARWNKQVYDYMSLEK